MEDDYEREYEDLLKLVEVEDEMIRFYIFNWFGLIGGLAALVWAAWTLHRYRRSGGKDSIFIITLLFIDASDLVAAVCLMFPRSLSFISDQIFVQNCCFVLRLVSLFLHQLVALEGVASVTHIGFAAVFSSVPSSVSLTLMTFMLVIFIRSSFAFHISLCVSFLAVTTVVPVLIHALMCILICSKAKPHQVPERGITEKTVLVESLVSYIVLHGPCLLAEAMYLAIVRKHGYRHRKINEYLRIFWRNMYSISSLWVLVDSLLVVLVYRLPRVQRS